MSWATVSTPHQAATGTLAYTASEIPSQASMTGLGGSRSIHAPAGTPIMTQGIQTIAVSRVTMNVLVCRVSIATSGTTITVTELPTSLMLSPVQNSAKFRCRHSPPRWPFTAGGSWRIGCRSTTPEDQRSLAHDRGLYATSTLAATEFRRGVGCRLSGACDMRAASQEHVLCACRIR